MGITVYEATLAYYENSRVKLVEKQGLRSHFVIRIVLSNFLIVLLVIEFGTVFFQATATVAVIIVGGDVRKLGWTQYHRLAPK